MVESFGKIISILLHLHHCPSIIAEYVNNPYGYYTLFLFQNFFCLCHNSLCLFAVASECLPLAFEGEAVIIPVNSPVVNQHSKVILCNLHQGCIIFLSLL